MATKHATATATPTNVEGNIWETEQRQVAAGGGLVVAADILVIRMLILLWQILVVPQKKWWHQLLDIEHMHTRETIDKRCNIVVST
jgi:hypothetical protein